MSGGQAVLAKYGREHFRNLRRRWGRLYSWKPVGTSGYALVRRDTGEIVAITGDLPYKRRNP